MVGGLHLLIMCLPLALEVFPQKLVHCPAIRQHLLLRNCCYQALTGLSHTYVRAFHANVFLPSKQQVVQSQQLLLASTQHNVASGLAALEQRGICQKLLQAQTQPLQQQRRGLQTLHVASATQQLGSSAVIRAWTADMSTLSSGAAAGEAVTADAASPWQSDAGSPQRQQQQVHEQPLQGQLVERADRRLAHQQLQFVVAQLEQLQQTGDWQQQEERHALLDQALELVLQQLPHANLRSVYQLLQAFQMEAVAVPPAAMQQILGQALQQVNKLYVPMMLRLLRSASYSKLMATATLQADPSSSSSSSSMNMTAATSSSSSSSEQWPSVLPLLQRLAECTAPDVPKALYASSVPQVLRCASVLGQQLPQPVLDQLVQCWLDHQQSLLGPQATMRGVHSDASSPRSSIHQGAAAAEEGGGAGSTGASSSGSRSNVHDHHHQQQQLQQIAAHTSMLLKAVACLRQQLQPQHLHGLLQPLLHMVDSKWEVRNARKRPWDRQGPSPPGSPAATAAAIEMAAWLPHLLQAAHQPHSGMRDTINTQQRAQLVALVGYNLRHLTAAASASAASAAAAAASEVRGSRPTDGSSGSSGSVPLQEISQAIIKYLAALSSAQRGFPLASTPGLVDQIVNAVLMSRAPASAVMYCIVALAGLNEPPSPAVMAHAVAAVMAGLNCSSSSKRQQQGASGDGGLRVDEQGVYISGRRVSRFLWACAAMGYSLQERELLWLLQRALLVLVPPVTFPAAQALWALTSMGSPTTQQQQQQQDQVQPLSSSSLPPAVANVAAALLQAALEEQHSAAQPGQGSGAAVQGSRDDVSDRPGDVIHGCDNAADEGDAARLMYDEAWYDCGVYGNEAWQISLLAWSAAMCDLAQCKEAVLQLCRLLGQPHMWSSLRQTEVAQLAVVHMWLCGDYLWSNTAGLGAVLEPRQLALVRAARVLQARGIATSKGNYLAQLAKQRGHHKHQQQQQQQCGKANAGSSSSSSRSRSGSRGRAGARGGGIITAQHTQQQVQSDEPQMLDARHLPPVVLDQYAAAVAAKVSFNLTGPSNAQTRLFREVESLKEVRSARLEVLTADELFSVDVEAVTQDGQLVAFEFDGPFHYTRAVQLPGPPTTPGAPAALQGSDAGGGGQAEEQQQPQEQRWQQYWHEQWHQAPVVPVPGRRRHASLKHVQHSWEAVDSSLLVPLHPMQFRNRALRARGYVVVPVAYYQWCQMPVPSRRLQYLRSLLLQALEQHDAQHN